MDWFENGLYSKNELCTISKSLLTTSGIQIDSLHDYEQVASYNWYGTPEHPCIVVPGAPRRLINWPGGQLQPDSGTEISDKNHHMMPQYPIESVFRALLVLSSETITVLILIII